MAHYSYERLSAQDASFLWAEGEHAPMHIASTGIFEAGPLRNDDGGVDIARFRHAVESVLHWIPRYRQKLAWTPIEGWPVWVDDRYFDLGYHVRHLSLPRPGTLEQLKEIASRILARPLDRARPLWEIWVIEGLEGGDQFAVLNKMHHCMIDGAAGADISQILMSASASVEVEDPLPYMPRPAPTGPELLRDSMRDRAGMTLDALRRSFERSEGSQPVADEMLNRARALAELAGYALKPASPTPINGDLSPHRRFDWLTMPLDDLLELRSVLGCSVNDIVLATVAGAVRRYFFRRRVDAAKLDFRVATPVSRRKQEHERRQGNHVSTWIVGLPLAEADPLKRVAAIRDRTAELKRSESALGAETLMLAAEWLPPAMIAAGVSLVQGPANMIVTNVPGPQFPLYSVGAPLLALYPVVPLIPSIGLGIALFSYDGKLCWGFNADYELVPDLTAFVAEVGTAFEELRAATVTEYMERRTAKPEEAGPAEEDAEKPVKPAKAAKPRANGKAPAVRPLEDRAEGREAEQAPGG